jgi:DNA-directed RNA polymerase specialized sigma24 family protein
MEDLADLKSDADSPHEIAERTQSRIELVRNVVHGMRDAEAEVLVMKYALEMDVREIAETIGRTCKAAESLLSRARESFRAAYTAAIREYEGELHPEWAGSPEPGA